MTVHVRAASSAADREACFAIRIAVFVDEQQGVPADAELDGHEPTATHLLAFSGGRPAGTLRWRVVPPSAAKIERVAVLREARSLGVGRALLAEALRQVAARRRSRKPCSTPKPALKPSTDASASWQRATRSTRTASSTSA